jgi:hypothetical protein
LDVDAVLGAPALVRARFIAADRGAASIVEAGVDDLLLQAEVPTGAAPGTTGPTALLGVANPFHGGAACRIRLATAAHIRLVLHDVRGRVVRTLVDAPLPAGERTATWDGRDARGVHVSAGVYWLRLVTPETTSSRKIVVLSGRD